ncbi:MAG: hypothetical protein HND39_12500 [Ignavibacteriota bacterium]|jgi:hypothetical protein|nr:MAG: hypothetical protein EDM72_11670 [Chlorobiota bacterium]MBE7477098.1 hypothetical protein [Ignavibacteriales bacterium]MBL1121300.1 hypothetical protein [Ignavibacteriota bacterium]MBV6419717.1 hypothetical protein [Ignavibacteriaceae bacterium]MCE7855133.1 hypothetical protein [Ignavibacteria bacterium CHB3]MEB2295866.1 hypothetical protein [Ignavibacteria bacterium]
MKILYKIILILSFPLFQSLCQGSAGDMAKYEYRYLIDMPTAGVLERGVVGVTTEILPYGVLIASIEAGVFENVSIGISYGGDNLIGSGKVDWYNWPGVSIRGRIINEATFFPAITIGFDSQGKGIYEEDTDRFAIKSPGFFGAVSKNFDFLGYMSFHGVVNYSLEGNDGDNFIDLRAGLEKTLGSSFSLLVEYDFAFNDNNTDFGSGKGYLNAGLRWSIGTGFTAGFDLRDLLSNKPDSKNAADRSFKIEYIKSIF